ncbi:MAG: UvrD-helicase domain-containing protein [Lachnospiraceae bacterium]|nr:UvrD-helicase domain-containing protein [Lachnospiraceae bacterium]
MKWTTDQQKVIDSRNCNLLVSAAAGSGKTAVLVERIIQMISDKENPMDIDELLVVTFTKAAAVQMRDKIAMAIEKMLDNDSSNEHYVRQLNYINKANILTIDSFCYQVVKEHFHVLGIDPGIRVGEAGELGLLRESVLERVIESFYENNSDFTNFSDAFSSDKNDEVIERYILKVSDICSSYPRPSEWIRRAKDNLHVESEEQFVALPFVVCYFEEIRGTAKGIKDKVLSALDKVRDVDGPLYMEKALLSDVMMVDDMIAAKTYSQFRDIAECKFANIGRGKKGEYDEDIADAVKKIREEYKKQINTLLSVFLLPFEQVLEQFQKQESMLGVLLDITESFRTEFLKAKLEKGILEFSDVEHFALQILCKEYDENGEPVPSDIGKEMAEDFKEILIDEYQDSNFLQEAILKCVSTLHKGEYNIFMVGDVKQSIYSFRMARPDLFMEKYHTYDTADSADCRKLLLKNNFRSRSNVLETINYMFYQIMGEDLGGIEYTSEEALVPGREFPEVNNDSVELLLGESKDFEFLKVTDEEMTPEKDENLDENLEDIGKKELEATIVARRILSLLGRDGSAPHQVVDDVTDELRDVRLSDMVILFRAPSSFQQIFSEVLMSYNIPVKVQNESGYFDTTEIQLVLSLLRVLDNPHNDVEVAAVLRSYFTGFNSDELAVLALIKRSLNGHLGKKMYIFQVVKLLAKYVQGKANLASELNDCEVTEQGEQADVKFKSNTEMHVVQKNKHEGQGNEKEITCIEILRRIIEEELVECKNQIIDNICKKCASFVSLMDDLQEQKSYKTVSQILTAIYYEKGYYYYVEAMPEGIQRIRNLDLFYEECRRFENGGFRTLFDFILFIDKLQKKSISLGGDPAPESSEDVVRIMSIHKSKGLEFPVVFLSGIGKNFNLMDTKTPLIIHSDYYVGAKYVDTDKRCGNDTFSRKAFASLMVTESITEELRILYVALTRAKEKLIMTGVTPDMTKLIRKYEMVATRKEQKLSYAVIHTAKNYLDMIVMSFIRNEEFHSAMENVRKRLDDKTDNILSAEYDLKFSINAPEIRLHTEIYDFRNLVVQHVQSNLEKQVNRGGRLEEFYNAPAKDLDELRERLTWQYTDEIFTLQKSKMSVTEIKRLYETDYEPSDVVEHPSVRREEYVAPVPRFVAGEQPMDAAAKGTWVHKMMEMLSNVEVTTMEQVQSALEDMWQTNRLPEETRTFITANKVYAFVASNLGKRMHEAAKKGNLYKEKQFVVGVSAKRLMERNLQKAEENTTTTESTTTTEMPMNEQQQLSEQLSDNNTPIVVQGIIDAYFREGDDLILVDYKTDKVKPGQENMLVERYRTQLLYYKDTLEQLTGLKVTEMYIYSYALDKEIRV